MKTYEIMFDDLKEEAQKELLKFYNVEDKSELNVDINPMCTIEVEDEDEFDTLPF